MNRIYLDNAATTPTDPRVIKAMQPYLFERFGNASSPHHFGQDAYKGLEDSRQIIAGAIGANVSEIIFNSGATEGNNHAIFGLARPDKNNRKHLIISSIEHHSVLEPAEHLEREGYRVSYAKADPDGLIDPQSVKDAITEETILIAMIHASNEIGTLQPVEAVGSIAKEAGIPFLVDATQTVGHMPVDVEKLNADILTFSAHKLYGPKGVGVLYIRKGTPVSPFLYGGDQERSQRASTQNVAGAVGTAEALKLCLQQMDEESVSQSNLRDRLLREVPKLIGGVKVNGHLKRRLANNAHFSFVGVEGESLLMSLDMAGIAASMGSACTSGAMEASHVLRAIGLSDELAYGSLRVTLGRFNTAADIDYVLDQLPGIIKRLRI